MKWLFLVLALLSGCYSPATEEDDMSNNAQYAKGGGWSSSKTLHNDGVSNMGLQVNFLPGREDNPIPSKGYTVQFFVGQAKNAAGIVIAGLINPVAEITWSVDGNSVRRVVSVTNGMSVSGIGEAIKVVVTDRTFNNGVGTTAVTYDMSVSVAPGTRPSENQPATYNPTLATTLASIEVVPGAEAVIQMPPNAGIISAFVTASPLLVGTVLVQNNAQVIQIGTAANITRIYDPLIYTSFVPIMAQTSEIRLRNNLGGGGTNILFSITFGIDG